MRRLLSILIPVLFVAFFASACDSNEDESDDQILLGDWTVVKARSDDGDLTADLNNAGRLSVSFDANNYTIRFDAVVDENDRVENGSYRVENGKLTLNVTVLGVPVPVPVPITYRFVDDDTLELEFSGIAADIVNQVLDADYDGDIVLTLERD